MSTPFFISNVSYVVRVGERHEGVAAAMRTVLRDADPTIPVQTARELSELVSSSLLTPRFQSRVLFMFSAMALALAMIGIYGVLAYGVTQRRHEIGIRVALGATARQVRLMVLRRTAVLAVLGMAVGIVASVGLTRVLSKLLFQVEPTDPLTFAVVGCLLAAVAFGAAYWPARRASRVDPLVALRRD
jgi:ABC-type antimicrobial peptide transport system permease subunit